MRRLGRIWITRHTQVSRSMARRWGARRPPSSPPTVIKMHCGSSVSLQPWRRGAIFLVKALHSAIFLSIAVSVVHVFYAGVTGRRSKWTRPALALALCESAIFAAWRFQCPLRIVAENLGAESGQVTDIFLPRWLADRIPFIFTPLLAIGLAGMLRDRMVPRAGARPPAHGSSEVPEILVAEGQGAERRVPSRVKSGGHARRRLPMTRLARRLDRRSGRTPSR